MSATVIPVRAESVGDDKLASEVLDREIELQMLNQRLNLIGANPSFSRARRTWLWDMANAVPTEGGLIAATALFHGHSSDKIVQSVQIKDGTGTGNGNGNVTGIQQLEPKLSDAHNHVPDSKVAATIIPQIAGQVIGGSGAIFELSTDYQRLKRLKEQKLNASAVITRVSELKQEIDIGVAQLASRVTQADDIRANELRILTYIRDKSLVQFSALEAATRRNSIGRIIEDAASATRNSIGTVGNSINVAAIMQNNKRLNGQGAILNLVSASMITSRAFVSTGGSYLAKRISQKRTEFLKINTEQRLENSTLESEVAALSKSFSRSGSEVGDSLKARLAVYKEQCAQFAEDDDLAASEVRTVKKQILRRYRESLYGPTKVAQASIGVVIGFRDLNNVTIDNRLAAAGNLTYCSGQVFNIFELARERIIDEERHAHKKAAGLLPEQRLLRSAERLKVMQGSLR